MEEIIGHSVVIKSLESDLHSGSASHAYLFSGSAGIGKYTVAKRFSSQIHGKEEVKNLDTFEPFLAEGSIKIDQVKNLIDQVFLTAQTGHKVFLIKDIERMTREAANAFLKVLEEPPEGTVFIATTSHLGGLLPTIISRFRVVPFSVPSTEETTKFLQSKFSDHSSSQIEFVCNVSGGKLGKAISILSDPSKLETYQNYHSKISACFDATVAEKFALVEEIVDKEGDIEAFFEVLSFLLRKKLLAEERESLKNSVDELFDSYDMIGKNVNSRLVLENLMLNL